MSENCRKKASPSKSSDGLRAEYDLSQLAGGVRGKYYLRAAAETNLMLIEPDLAKLFPDSDAVNRTLRVLAGAVVAVSSKRRRGRSA
jgi:hypothetical protein